MGSPLRPNTSETNRMGKIDGVYVMESHTNEAAKIAALGLSEEDIRKYVDPKNVIRMELTETSPDCLEIKTTVSNLPDFNNTICLKLGERKEMKVPFEWALTMTKKSGNAFVFKTEMNGRVMEEDCVFHSYGLSVTGTVGAVSFSEEYKKSEVTLSGYYIYQSGSGLADIFKWFDMPFDEKELLKNGGFRLLEKNGGFWIEELYGGSKKEYFAPLNEEFEYDRPEWNVSDKRITTRVAPGVLKTVCKSKKDGKVWDWTCTFTDTGLTIETNAGGCKATEYYKRGCDFSGHWTTVAYSGGEGYCAALGMTEEQKTQHIAGTLSYKWDVSRQPHGVVQIKSNSPYTPGGVLNVKAGEPWSYQLEGFGTIENIGHETCNHWTMVTKINGRTITTKEKYSGDFCISEATVENIQSSTAVTIFTRD